MNRSTFFKTLGIGIAAAPTLARVLVEEPKAFTFRKVSERQPVPMWYADEISRDMQRRIAHHIATHNPYAGLLLETDKRPLRFNA